MAFLSIINVISVNLLSVNNLFIPSEQLTKQKNTQIF